MRALRQSDGLPPIVCVLTHIDAVAKTLISEAVEAVASDLDLTIDLVTPVCVKTGHYDNIEAVSNAILSVLEKAQHLKQIRCIRQIRREHDEQTMYDNLRRFGRLGIGWVKLMTQKDKGR